MSEQFKREERYIVLKIKDVAMLSDADKDALAHICARVGLIRAERGKSPMEAVVVEPDWPCYTAVWGLVEMAEAIRSVRS